MNWAMPEPQYFLVLLPHKLSTSGGYLLTDSIFLLDAQYICSLCTFFLQSYSSARFDVLFDLNILNNVNDFMIGVFYRGGRSCDLGNLDLSFDSAKAAGKRNYLDKVNRSINIVKVIKYLSSVYIFFFF